MTTPHTQPPAQGTAAHTPWNDRIMFTGMTGPTTPCIGGPTAEEQCEYADYWRKPEPRDKTQYPKARHTPIGYGDTVTAIAVGENHKERAAFIVEACNTHATHLARIKVLESALAGAVSALENVDRHVGVLGGELAALRAARAALPPVAGGAGMSAWTPKTRKPTRRGWYITRTEDGMIDWRAWGCGAWWKQIKGGWIKWYDGDGQAMTYDWKKESRENINLERHELKEPKP